MTDSSRNSRAWTHSPAAYLATRERPGAAPVRTSFYIPARDGTQLAADLYLPTTGTPVPTIIAFTPYYRRFALASGSNTDPCPGLGQYRDWFPRFGYAFLAVDTRGTGASFGSRTGMRAPQERTDYHDVINWVAHQPWSSGAVGITGISYVGAAADFAASLGHPAIRAVMPISSVWDTWVDMFYPGGLLFTGMLGKYGRMIEALDLDQRETLAEYPYFSNPDYAGPAPVDADTDGAQLRAALLEHDANFDMTDFITQLGLRGDALRHDPGFTTETIAPKTYLPGMPPHIAHYGVSGWMDGAGYTAGAISRWHALPNHEKRLLLGPWDHGMRTQVSPARTAGPRPRFELLAETLRFFDQHVAGIETGIGAEQPVHYYTMVEEAWHAADRFPPAATMRRWALAARGNLIEASGEPGADTYRANQSLGTGRHTRYERIGGAAVDDYYDDWHGRDAAMLCWTSPASAADLEITGTPVAELWLEVDAADSAVILYLEDVGPDGATRYMTEGALRASCRAVATPPPDHPQQGPYHPCTRETQAHLNPGTPVKLEIALHPTSWLLRTGHRLRLALAGADRDHLARTPFGYTPTFTVHRGGAMPSALFVPEVTR